MTLDYVSELLRKEIKEENTIQKLCIEFEKAFWNIKNDNEIGWREYLSVLLIQNQQIINYLKTSDDK